MGEKTTAYDLWLEGIKASDKQHFSKAIEKYKQAYKLDPEFSDVYESWADAALASPDPDARLAELHTTISKHFAGAKGYFILGNAYLKQEKYQKSIAAFRQALEQDEDYADAWTMCGLAHDKAGQFDEAIVCYEHANDLYPNSPVTLNNWGWVLAQKKEYPAAIAKYKAALNADPSHTLSYANWASAILELPKPDPEINALRDFIEQHYPYASAYVHLARVLRELKRYDEASLVYKQVLALDPSDSVSYLNWGWIFHQQANYTAAIEQYKKALRIRPDYELAVSNMASGIAHLPEPAEELEALYAHIEKHSLDASLYKSTGSALLDQKKYRAAVDAYERAIAKKPDYADAYNDCGLAYLRLQEYDKAIKCYQLALTYKPDMAIAYNNWGWVLDEQEDYEGAIVKYKQALELSPGYATAMQNWANAITHLKDPEPELAIYRRMVEKDLATADAYNKLGNLLLNLKRNSDALSVFRRAIAADASNADAHLNYGNALHYTGDYQGAIKAYQTALKHREDYAVAYNNIGTSYNQLGEYTKAIEAYRKAIDIDPNYESPYIGWSYDINRSANPEQELKDFKKVIQEQYDTAKGNNLIGTSLYYDFKQYDQAVEYFNKAIEIEPDLAEAYFNLGNVLRDMFRYDEAIQKFEQAIKHRDHSYYYHNHADILQKLGLYKEARQKWQETIHAYLRCEQDQKNAEDASFYLYYGSICHEIFKDYETAEYAYRRSVDIDPNRHSAYIALARLYLEQKENAISESEADRKMRNSCNHKAWDAYRRADKLIQTKGADVQDISALLDLVELYMLFDKLDTAKKYLSMILDKEPDNLKAITARGVLLMKQEKYKYAAECFTAALEQDPDLLDTRANLARTKQKLGHNMEAENEYQKVLSIAGCHVDSIIGLSEVYIVEAENAEKKSNAADAIVYYNKAIHLLSTLLEHTEPLVVHLPEVPLAYLNAPISRYLSQKEISSIYYSLGYAKTRLSEARKHNDTSLLEEAKTYFSQVKFGTPNYFKAERAGNKLKELLNSLKKSSSTGGASAVFWLALSVFLLTQVGFFIGKPVIGYSELTVNHAVFDSLLKAEKVDSKLFDTEIAKLKRSTFTLDEQILAPLRKILGKEELDVARLSGLIQGGGDMRLKGFDRIGDTTYALLTFGAMIFMVAGLFLREITRLKFGAVELEKASMDQVSVSTSLNITR